MMAYDVANMDRTAQENYEAACDEYHQWFLEQQANEERALAEQELNDSAGWANLIYHVIGDATIPIQPVTHGKEVTV